MYIKAIVISHDQIMQLQPNWITVRACMHMHAYKNMISLKLYNIIIIYYTLLYKYDIVHNNMLS